MNNRDTETEGDIENNKVNTTVKSASFDELNSVDSNKQPNISWDIGTAYDFFMSLYVLHDPEKFGLRASWAAGVRSRLSTQERRILKTAIHVFHVPLCWIYSLPEPKDTETALWAIRQIPAESRMATLTFCAPTSQDIHDVLENIAERGNWDEQDLETLREAYKNWDHGKESPRRKELVETLDAWANAVEFGEKYLSALQSYYNSFFAEEQRRILPAIQSSLERAVERAEQVPLEDLIEELSRGIRFEKTTVLKRIVLAPSYWITPLIYSARLDDESMLIVFGGRPEDKSIVPGEEVPENILLGLKALSDPTRLRILSYLKHEDLSPTDLARRLRLRPPTVIHHLRSLRLAGLVHLTVSSGKETHYTARPESVDELCARLNSFLESEVD